MQSIFDYLEFVNKQAAFHEQKAQEFQGDKRHWLHRKTAERFHGLASQIESLKKATILRQVPGANPLALTSGDVEGLPPELLEQLVNLPDSDKLEAEIVEIINQAGGTLLLDHLLISLFRRTGEVYQRHLLVSKLYRMNKKGLVFSTSKKGVYTTIRPLEADKGDIEDDQTGELDLK